MNFSDEIFFKVFLVFSVIVLKLSLLTDRKLLRDRDDSLLDGGPGGGGPRGDGGPGGGGPRGDGGPGGGGPGGGLINRPVCSSLNRTRECDRLCLSR